MLQRPACALLASQLLPWVVQEEHLACSPPSLQEGVSEVLSCLNSGTEDPNIPGGSMAHINGMGQEVQCQSTSTHTRDTSTTTRGASTRATH